jgi:hypothetical protein
VENKKEADLAHGTATIEKIMDVMHYEYGTESVFISNAAIRAGDRGMSLNGYHVSKGTKAKKLMNDLKGRSSLLLNFDNALLPEEYRRGKKKGIILLINF